jgi:hypothetical protein
MQWQELSRDEIARWDVKLKKKFKDGLPSYASSGIVDCGVYQLKGRIFTWPHFICYSITQDEHTESQYFFMHFRFYGKKEQLNLRFNAINTTDNLARRIQKALKSPGVDKALHAELPQNAPEDVKITMYHLRTWLADCLTEVKQI